MFFLVYSSCLYKTSTGQKVCFSAFLNHKTICKVYTKQTHFTKYNEFRYRAQKK